MEFEADRDRNLGGQFFFILNGQVVRPEHMRTPGAPRTKKHHPPAVGVRADLKRNLFDEARDENLDQDEQFKKAKPAHLDEDHAAETFDVMDIDSSADSLIDDGNGAPID